MCEKNGGMKDYKRFQQFGYSKFGPFLYAYTKWLYDEIKKKNIKKVYFLARDGYMMKKSFDLFCARNNDSVESFYFYCSRRSLRNALIKDATNYEESLKYYTFRKVSTVEDILEYYDFNNATRKEIALQHNIDLKRNVKFEDLKTDNEIKKIFEQHKEDILNNSKRQYKLVVNYLEQNFLDGSVALVDIGWHGSMQYYLEQICYKANIKAYFTGYYIGNTSFSDVKGDMSGFLFDDDNPAHRAESMCFFGVLEKLFQSREGSTIGYRTKDGKVMPILDKYEYSDNIQIASVIRELQRAALKFVKNQLREAGNTFNRDKYIKPLLHFGKYPSLTDTDMFSFFYNVDGHKIFFTSQKELFQYSLSELLNAFRFSPWKTGFMKSLFKIPFPYYLIYKALS